VVVVVLDVAGTVEVDVSTGAVVLVGCVSTGTVDSAVVPAGGVVEAGCTVGLRRGGVGAVLATGGLAATVVVVVDVDVVVVSSTGATMVRTVSAAAAVWARSESGSGT
jgi:hypothetical protein